MAGRCRTSKGALLALRAAQSFASRSCPRSATAAAPAPAPPEQPLADPAQQLPASSSGARHQQPPAPLPPPPAVDFADAQEAFRSKSSGELARGLLVLGLCSLEPLVEHEPACPLMLHQEW
uniref:Uncharacterized protein n=1 Tax=Podarcis muralis TaxID=64176 RepID=A0A670JNH8_PODMU